MNSLSKWFEAKLSKWLETQVYQSIRLDRFWDSDFKVKTLNPKAKG